MVDTDPENDQALGHEFVFDGLAGEDPFLVDKWRQQGVGVYLYTDYVGVACMVDYKATNAQNAGFLLQGTAERYVRAVCDRGIDVESILVITYTRKAAGELRSRIRSALRTRDRPDLARELDGAWISTIACNRAPCGGARPAGRSSLARSPGVSGPNLSTRTGTRTSNGLRRLGPVTSRETSSSSCGPLRRSTPFAKTSARSAQSSRVRSKTPCWAVARRLTPPVRNARRTERAGC